MIQSGQNPTPAAVARFYDEADFFYRDSWGESVHHGYWRTGNESPEEAIDALDNTLLDQLDVARGETVGDIGCGYGRLARLIAERFQARVTGFTLSPRQHRLAESRATLVDPPPRFVLGDWLENDLADASIAALVSVECLSHVADKDAFFRECARVLKPGGRLVFTAWLAHADPPDWSIDHLLEPICRDGAFAGIATLTEYQELIAGAGLITIESADLGPRVARTWNVLFRRLALKTLTNRQYLRHLINATAPGWTRSPALTVLRTMLAYRLGHLGYGLFTVEKS